MKWAFLAGKFVRRYGAFMARIIVLFYLFTPLMPTPPRVELQPPQTVETQHPIVCAHTRLIDEVEDWKIQRTLQLVREMGAPSIVEFFYWAYIQPAPNALDWTSADRIINLASDQGLTVIARLGVVPGWARPPDDPKSISFNYLTRDYYDEFAHFVGLFAERYRGKVSHIIIWNEPNLGGEWGYGEVDPANYVELLKKTFTAAHTANPEVIVLGGALAPTNEPGGIALNDLIYLRQMYELGAKDYFDALAVHTYGFTEPPEAEPGADRLNFRRFELLQEIMREFGDGEKDVYITETAWNDHPRWTKAVRPGQRIQYTLDALKLAERDWPTVKSVCFYYFRYPTLYRNYNDYWSFVTMEFRVKPIYTAVKAYARGINDTSE